MKTTIELPDATFRQAKALAASRGITLRQFFTDALEDKLRRCTDNAAGREHEAPWMAGFGALADLSHEHRRVAETIAQEFETLAPEVDRVDCVQRIAF